MTAKYYNKTVSNVEEGKNIYINSTQYVACLNEHLEKILNYLDVQKRDLTRFEIGPIGFETNKKIIGKPFKKSFKKMRMKRLFCIQLKKNQSLALDEEKIYHLLLITIQ